MQPIVCVCSACARLAQILSNAPVTVHEIHTQAQVVFFGWGALCASSVRRSNTPTENLLIQPTISTSSMSILDVRSQNISMPFVLHQWHVTQVWLKDIFVIYGYESVDLTLLHLCTRLSAAHLNCKLGIDFFFFFFSSPNEQMGFHTADQFAAFQ